MTLTAIVLTVVVMDYDMFDDLFGEAVGVNIEGVLVTASESASVSEGVSFTEESVNRLLAQGPMVSPGACLLEASLTIQEENPRHLTSARKFNARKALASKSMRNKR